MQRSLKLKTSYRFPSGCAHVPEGLPPSVRKKSTLGIKMFRRGTQPESDENTVLKFVVSFHSLKYRVREVNYLRKDIKQASLSDLSYMPSRCAVKASTQSALQFGRVSVAVTVLKAKGSFVRAWGTWL